MGNISDNGSLEFNQSSNSSYSGIISGAGSLTQNGSGTLTLFGANTYSGTISVSSGTLQAGAQGVFSASPNVVMSNAAGAVLNLNGYNQTVGSLSGGGTLGGNITLGAATLTLGSSPGGTYSGVISGSGGITSLVTNQTLAGVNTYSGTTLISAGNLIFSGDTSQLGGNIVNNASLTFDQTTNSTFSGIISGTGILTQEGSNNLVLSAPNTYSGLTTILSGTLTFSANTSVLGNISDAGALVFAQTNNSSFSGDISGTGSVSQNGSAILTFYGTNSYTGNTNVTSGTLQAGALDVFSQNSPVVMSNVLGALLDLNNFDQTIDSLSGGGPLGGNVNLGGSATLTLGINGTSSTFSGQMSGSGSLVKSGSGIFTLTGVNSFFGTTSVDGGILKGGAPNIFSPNSPVVLSNVSGVTLDLGGFNQVIGSLSGGGTIGGDVNLRSGILTLGGIGTSTSYYGTISGNTYGGLTKTGTGTLTLYGTSIYGGRTSVNQGVLQAGTTDVFAASSTVVMGNISGATLDLNSFNQTIGSLSGGGVTGGNVTLGTATLTLGGDGKSTSYYGVISGSGGSLYKVGAGVFTLYGTNTYSGSTTVNGGVVRGGATNAFSPTSTFITADSLGVLLDLNSFSQTIGGLSGGGSTGGNVTLGIGTLTLGGNNVSTTYAGAIIGAGGLVKQGTGVFTLSGANNTYSGQTTVNQGVFQAGVTNAFSRNSTVAMANTSGATLNLNGFDQIVGALSGGGGAGGNVTLGGGTLTLGGNNAMTTYQGVISGGGGVTKVGVGTFTLTGANTFLGLMTISTGTLNINGSLSGNVVVNGGMIMGTGSVAGNLTVNSQGTVAPGNSIGTLNVGSYTNNGGTYQVEINGVGASDLINCSGAAVINGGQVVVTSIDGIYDFENAYTIVTADSVTGTYSGVTSTLSWIVPVLSYDARHVYLEMTLDIVSAAATCNELAVAKQIENLTVAHKGQIPWLNQFLSLSTDQMQEALNQLSGQQHTNDLFSTTMINRNFIRRLYDPIRYIVTTKRLAQSYCHPCYGIGYDTSHDKFDFWVEGGPGCMHVDNTKMARGFHLNGYEVTFGVQRSFLDNWTAGVAGSYESDDILYNYYGRGRSKTWLGGAYCLYRPNHCYGIVDLTYGHSKRSMRRSVNIQNVSYKIYSKPKITQYTFYVEMGIDKTCGNFLIQPFVGLETALYRSSRVVEKSQSMWNLIVHQKEKPTVNARLGLHMTANKLPYNSKISLDAAWNKRLTDSNDVITEKFVYFGDAFNIYGVDVDGNSFECALTASTCVFNSWRFYIEGDASLWNRAYMLNVLGGVEFTW